MENGSALQEKKKHGETRFPFNIYPCTIPKDFTQVALHWQSGMELVFVKKGAGVIQAGHECFHAQAGDIFVFVPGMLHALSQIAGETMEYENIIFDLELLDSMEDLCNERYLMPIQSGRMLLPSRITPGHACYEAASAFLEKMEEVNRTKKIGYELEIKGILMQLLALLISHSGGIPPAETADTKQLKVILKYITEHYAEELTIDRAASICNCSASHFMRWFKRMTGQSFTVFVNTYRLNAAAESLRTSNDTVLTIAGQVGFKNLSHFNRAFKKQFGVPPREYRRI